ncbi:MAG: hypothetical protein PHX21_07875 [bacterium]|nr:hypothetical protein [bacterium]
MKNSSKEQKSKKLRIEFIEYTGKDKDDRIQTGLDLLVKFLLRKYNAKKSLPAKKTTST